MSVGKPSIYVEPKMMKSAVGRMKYEDQGLLEIIDNLKNYRFSMSRLSTIPLGEQAGALLEEIISNINDLYEARTLLADEIVEKVYDFEKADQYFSSLTVPGQMGAIRSTYGFLNQWMNFGSPYNQSFYIDKTPFFFNYVNSPTMFGNTFSIGGEGQNGEEGFLTNIYNTYQAIHNYNASYSHGKSGAFGSKGIGNAEIKGEVKGQQIKIKANASLVDSNKGIENTDMSQKILNSETELSFPYPSQFKEDFTSGALIGGENWWEYYGNDIST